MCDDVLEDCTRAARNRDTFVPGLNRQMHHQSGQISVLYIY